MHLKDILRPFVPKPLRRAINRQLDRRYVAKFERDFARLLPTLKSRPGVRRPIEKILIAAPDPGSFMGSLGDDAMMTSTIDMARRRNPDVRIHVVTGGRPATEMAAAHGFVPEDIWFRRDIVPAIVSVLENNDFDAVVAPGADIMDGYFDYMVSAKVLAVAEIAARLGIPVSVLGFSFNSAPLPGIVEKFNNLDGRVKLNLRDPISYERFTRLTRAEAKLAADSAFMLTPTAIDADVMEWLAKRRAESCRIVGFNLHPMLYRDATPAQIKSITEAGLTALQQASQERNIAWVLIPHDVRDVVGDTVCLDPIYETLAAQFGNKMIYLKRNWRASQIKALAGKLDCLVTGRMHLAIASLGMGVPVMCVTYHEKFEGLFQYFGLPDWLMKRPEEFLETGTFSGDLQRFVDQFQSLGDGVNAHLPDILALSESNFRVYDEA